MIRWSERFDAIQYEISIRRNPASRLSDDEKIEEGGVMAKQMDPAMHSAEHILNQTMDRLYGCGRCISAHIERKKSKCDYRFNRDLTKKETREIESAVNTIINQHLEIIQTWLSRSEAEKKLPLDRLPAEAGDDIRLISVGDYDVCPCVGAHVQNTKEIGRFYITSTSVNADVLRIRFKLDRN